MKYLLLLTLATFSISANDAFSLSPIKHESNVSIYNGSKSDVVIWVNGEKQSISSHSVLWTPCLPDGVVQVYYLDHVEDLLCGSFRVLEL